MRFLPRVVAGILLASVALVRPGAVLAQGSRLGPSLPAIAGAARGSAVAYDPLHNIYLVVSVYGDVNGQFVSADGEAIGSQFTILSGAFSHYPQVEFSPNANGGQGGFLVSWHQSRLPSGATPWVRMVYYAGATPPTMTAPVELTAEGSWWEASAQMAYSTISNEFLVAWQSAAGVRAWRISPAGAKLGDQIFVNNPAIYARDPSVAYNPATNQFLVVYAGADTSAFVAAQLIAPGSGALVGGPTLLQRAAATYITNVAFNSTTNQFLAIWWQNGGAFGRLVDASNAPVTGILAISVQISAYDALGLDYNPATNTFMYVSHDRSSYQNGAVEIKANAVPDGTGFIATDMPARNGNFYPQVTANTKRPQWLLSTATDFTSTTVQRLQSAGTVQTLPTTSFVTVVPGAGGLRLRWAPVAGASSYTIRRMDANGTTVVASGVTSTTFLDINGIPAMGVQYTVTAVNGSSESIPRPILIPWGSAGSRTPTVMTPQDYDGDGRTDVTVYRSSSGEWISLKSSTQTATGWWWGAPAHQDQPVPSDYDGDGRADIAVYRRSTGEWFIRRSTDDANVHHYWGSPIWGDLPVPADYDGDGQTDMAVYRQATGGWFILRSSAGFMTHSWGSPDYADIPVPGDYDGDGKADLAVYRGATGEWLVRRSTTGTLHTMAWGDPSLGDVPIPCGLRRRQRDGHERLSRHHRRVVRHARGGRLSLRPWGSPGSLDIPVPADYDGDGRADVAAYRFSSGEWFIRRSSNGAMMSYGWGNPAMIDSVRVF